MDYQVVNQYKGKNVQLNVKDKNITGILVQLDNDNAIIETDYGFVKIKNSDISDINQIKLVQDLFVYICKNEICNCKGIRLLMRNEKKISWPCKYFKKFQCPIKKVCNFNTLPLNIKNRFLNGMHSPIPPFQNK